MGRQSIEFQNVTFAYETLSEPLINRLSLQFYPGWTGVIGVNGVGKSTLLKLSTGTLSASQGQVFIPGNALYCQQRTDSPPDRFSDFINAMDHDAFVLKGQLLIEENWPSRWNSLSHGERKRAQIGTALWIQPAVLAIDEPTNHLDQLARSVLIKALQSFKGVGLLVSHDRELLDTLCRYCLFLDPPEIFQRPGNYSKVWKQIQQERESIQKQHLQANSEYKKLEREVKKRRSEALQADKKRSKRGIDQKDHDAKSKINMARLTGKDAVASKLMNQLEGRRSQAQNRLNQIKVKKTYETGIWQQGEKSKKDLLFSIPHGILSLGEGRQLSFPNLSMKPDDHVSLTGLNGTGKSTLLKHITESITLPPDRMICIPQEIDAEKSRLILQEVHQLPGDKLGHMMTVINRLGTRPPRLLESSEPSPGEVRKIMLAIGVANIPHLIVMDEPTNHLDLLSIDCLQDTLKDYPAGLLLISHDKRFLRELTTINWHITEGDNGTNTLTIHQV
ncbi:ATP-binding cassette domain-containing protein [bacterium]|nr:ATP-binding cassette domain-containing protein [bacterium]